LDLLKDEGKREGKREGKIETIKTITSLRFQETSRRLTGLLPRLNDLKFLNKACQYALTAPSLLDVENFVENLIPLKPEGRRVAKRRIA